MARSVHIPPEIAQVIEDFWREQIRQQFGETPPTPEEELAFIQEFRERGFPVVPLPDGSRVSIASAGPGAEPADFTGTEPQGPVGDGEKTPTWKFVLIGVVLLIIALPIVGAPLKSVAGRVLGRGQEGAGPIEEISLPADIDALVTSGDVRVPLVVPRTLEIAPNGALTSTTFVVVPVEVEEADWPCPSRKFKEQPAACWVFGTVVNYLVGIPNDEGQAEVLFDNLAGGGTAQLRMSTEQVFRFSISPSDVRAVERHQTEVLDQDHFGMTLVALGGDGGRRHIATASYVADEITGPSATLGGGPPAAPESSAEGVQGLPEETVFLGGRIELPEGVTIVPVQHRSGGMDSELVVTLETRGNLSYTPNWQAWGLIGEEMVAAEVTQAGENRVAIAAATPIVESWIIDVSGTVYRIVPSG